MQDLPTVWSWLKTLLTHGELQSLHRSPACSRHQPQGCQDNSRGRRQDSCLHFSSLNHFQHKKLPKHLKQIKTLHCQLSGVGFPLLASNEPHTRSCSNHCFWLFLKKMSVPTPKTQLMLSSINWTLVSLCHPQCNSRSCHCGRSPEQQGWGQDGWGISHSLCLMPCPGPASPACPSQEPAGNFPGCA